MKKKHLVGVVYSTNPDFEFVAENELQIETLPPAKQNLKIVLDKKDRGGKQVTLIKGFVGIQEDLKILEKQLKNLCGCGGTLESEDIMLQGDFREKVLVWLIQKGYKAKKI